MADISFISKIYLFKISTALISFYFLILYTLLFCFVIGQLPLMIHKITGYSLLTCAKSPQTQVKLFLGVSFVIHTGLI